MEPIELDELMRFLLLKYKLSEIQESLNRVQAELGKDLNPPPDKDSKFDSDLRHKIMSRKY
ncbi:MAG: hypothetical protein GF364_09350 [Candidatus Lokiarchaeota archaeon]|nr:hypothetical protein [Candidatus Lokiarchaeota archaeon]